MTVEELLFSAVADVDNGWSIGTFGAIAEFRRDADEPVEHSNAPAGCSARRPAARSVCE